MTDVLSSTMLRRSLSALVQASVLLAITAAILSVGFSSLHLWS